MIRNFRTYLASDPPVLTIPEGYSNGTRVAAEVRPADERPYAWSFVGEIKASRVEMTAQLKALEPHLLVRTASISDLAGTKLSKGEFDEVLSDTVFSPSPMGNVILETWRFYESLELGCIPLAERRHTLDFFDALLGPNPVPSFLSWSDARRYAEAGFADKPSLRRKQVQIRSWWAEKKEVVRAQVRNALTGRPRSAELQRYSSLARNRLPILHEPLRLMELLRHQSAASLGRRFTQPQKPLQRIMRESLQGSS